MLQWNATSRKPWKLQERPETRERARGQDPAEGLSVMGNAGLSGVGCPQAPPTPTAMWRVRVQEAERVLTWG